MGVSLEIDVEMCKGCGLCVDTCPIDYLQMSSKTNKKNYFYPAVNNSKECTGCGLCYIVCPDFCIVVSEV